MLHLIIDLTFLTQGHLSNINLDLIHLNNLKVSLEEFVITMATNNAKFQQQTHAAIKSLET